MQVNRTLLSLSERECVDEMGCGDNNVEMIYVQARSSVRCSCRISVRLFVRCDIEQSTYYTWKV